MKILALIALMILSACSTLTDKAKKLRIVTSLDEVKGCIPAGVVKSSSFGAGGDVLRANHNSSVDLKNLAAEHGDTLLMVKDDEHLFGSNREGKVFKCAIAKKTPKTSPIKKNTVMNETTKKVDEIYFYDDEEISENEE